MNNCLNYCRQAEKEKGAVAIIVALMLPVFLGIGALAIDIGHLMVVRNELQNAADAAALVGANQFYSKTPSGFSSTPPVPDWTSAEAAAINSISLNQSDGVTLTECEVESGYWNLKDPGAGLLGKTSPVPGNVPAVTVIVRRTAGKNGGAVQNFIGGILGIQTFDAWQDATAVCACPGTVKPGTLLPVAIPKWIADKGEDYNSPSEVVSIGSAYHYEDDPYNDLVAGQWTSLTEYAINDAKHMKDLIKNGNPNPLSVGDQIYIEPGTMAVGYHKNYMGLYVGKDIVLPVVDALLRDSVKQIPAPEIVGFIGFHVTELIKNKGFKGYFVKDMYIATSGGFDDEYYGAYAPPRLVE